jgi:hypothetical protein
MWGNSTSDLVIQNVGTHVAVGTMLFPAEIRWRRKVVWPDEFNAFLLGRVISTGAMR